MGLFGAHHFYVDRVKSGISIFLITLISPILIFSEVSILSILGILLLIINIIWILADIITITENKFTDANGQEIINSEASEQLVDLEALIVRFDRAVKNNDAVKAMGIARELSIVDKKLELFESQMTSIEKNW